MAVLVHEEVGGAVDVEVGDHVDMRGQLMAKEKAPRRRGQPTNSRGHPTVTASRGMQDGDIIGEGASSRLEPEMFGTERRYCSRI